MRIRHTGRKQWQFVTRLRESRLIPTERLRDGGFVHWTGIARLHSHPDPIGALYSKKTQPLVAVTNIERRRLTGCRRELLKYGYNVIGQTKRLLIGGSEAQSLRIKPVRPVRQACQQPEALKRQREPQDRALDQTSPLGQLGQAQGTVSPTERGQYRQCSFGC